MRTVKRSWKLTDGGGETYLAKAPGKFGGHRQTRIYGRLDCRTALQALARGGYAANRVFFAAESAARAAGYRPCAVCMPAEYSRWKADAN